jgi:Domain of unknown function (DUF4160)
MPEICRFNGIRIMMYVGDREHPPPHFHAEQGDDEALVCIATGRVLKGRLKTTSMKLVRSWVESRRRKLEENWKLARDGQELKPVLPP